MKKLAILLSVALASCTSAPKFFDCKTEPCREMTPKDAIVCTASECVHGTVVQPPEPPTPDPEPTEIGTIRTETGSYPGAVLGDWPDKLLGGYTIPTLGEFPRVYMHAEITSQTTLNAHRPVPPEYPNEEEYQKATVLPYVEMAERFGFAPYWFYTTETLNGAKFVAEHTKSPDVILPIRSHRSNTMEPAFLQSMEAYAQELKSQGRRAIAIPTDEPNEDIDPNYTQLVKDAATIKSNAPSILLGVTEQYSQILYDAGFRLFIPNLNRIGPHTTDRPWPSMDAYPADVEVWVYPSCMSHGCVGGSDKGVSDLVVDRDPVYYRSLGVTTLSVMPRAENLLYYHMMVQGNLPDPSVQTSIYREGGEMEGILFYKGPVPSLRMLEVAKAIRDMELYRHMLSLPTHAAWMLGEIRKIAPSQFEWSKDYAAYDDLYSRAYQRYQAWKESTR